MFAGEALVRPRMVEMREAIGRVVVELTSGWPGSWMERGYKLWWCPVKFMKGCGVADVRISRCAFYGERAMHGYA